MNFNELSQIIDAYYNFTGAAALDRIRMREMQEKRSEQNLSRHALAETTSFPPAGQMKFNCKK